jgi:hypothetical protein
MVKSIALRNALVSKEANAFGSPLASIVAIALKFDLTPCLTSRLIKYGLTLNPLLNQAEIGGFGGLQFSENGDENPVSFVVDALIRN